MNFAIRAGLFAAAAYMFIFGLIFGLILLSPTNPPDVHRVAWAMLAAAFAGVLIMLDLAVVEPWNRRRASRP